MQAQRFLLLLLQLLLDDGPHHHHHHHHHNHHGDHNYHYPIVIITNSGACGSGGAGWLQGPAPSKGNLTPRQTTGLPKGDKLGVHHWTQTL